MTLAPGNFAQHAFVDRALVHADPPLVEDFRRGQGAFLDDELLAGGEVGDAEVHLLRTLRGDGEVGQDQVDLVRRQQRDAVGRVGRQHLQPDAQLVGQGLGIVDVEAFDLLALGVDEAERRVAVEGRDAQYAGLADVLQAVGLGQAGDQGEGEGGDGGEFLHESSSSLSAAIDDQGLECGADIPDGNAAMSARGIPWRREFGRGRGSGEKNESIYLISRRNKRYENKDSRK